MTIQKQTYRFLSRSVAVAAGLSLFAAIARPTLAADKYWKGGAGDWDTTTANWSLTSGGAVDQVWVAGDNAIIEGSGDTITLAADMSISELHIATNNYTITGNRLLFEPSGVISNNGAKSSFTLRSGITGSPDVYITQAGNGGTVRLEPNEYAMVIGTLYRPSDSYMVLGGSVSGNTISAAGLGVKHNNYKTSVEGSGDWTIQNDSYVGELKLNGGALIAGGVFTSARAGWVDFNSGTLHYNAADVFGSSGYDFSGCDMDNSSGSAISSSSVNSSYSLKADLEFIGSAGADSDLTLGTGTVTMTGDRTITVSNVAATLTIGGAIDSSGYAYSLTKEGEGALKLTGSNTYLGETIVSEGALSITQTNSLSDLSFVRIAGGAVLNLDYTGTDKVLGVYTNGVQGPIGTWGRVGSGADNETALITGDGILNAPAPSAVAGIRWWDGGTTNIVAVGNQLSDGDGGTWSTSVANWDAGAGVAHTNWNNATNDTALLRGGGSTITLAEDIHMGDLLIDSDGYTITGNVLDFASGNSISNNGHNTVISSGITGSPDVLCRAGGNQNFSLQPNSASMTLGTIYRLADNYLYLRGTATGNTVAAMPYPTASGFYQQNVKVRKYDSGTWTVNGELYGGEITVDAGTLICNGRLWENKWNITIKNGSSLYVNGTMEGSLVFTAGTLGGTAVCSLVSVSVPDGSTLAPGYTTGVMTFSNAVTIAGTLAIEIDSGESPDYSSLDVDGTLDISAGTSTLDINVTSPLYGDLVIATYNSLVGSAFAVTNGLPDAATINYGANAITLTVPSPAGTLFLFE